jgi:hypothetical protein
MNLPDALSPPDAFEYEGRTYKVRELDLEQGAQFSQWLKDRALSEIARQTELPDEFRSQLRADVLREIAAGVYDWQGPVSVQAMFTPEGAAKVLQVALSRDHPGIELDTARKIVRAKLDQLAELMLRAHGPKSSAPAGSGAGRRSTPGSRTSRGKSGRGKRRG